ncbi:MAG: hypothetical protein DRQ42_01615 [Gammaproteobacteria bacterium]|nr:MAG: hypothetical protein DRQ42_01615 [Gammaproteobacteria bacterium]
MSIGSRKSGMIQRVAPFLTTQLTQITSLGGSTKGGDVQRAVKDPASSNAIPDSPTSEAPYDGLVCFGVFVVDVT